MLTWFNQKFTQWRSFLKLPTSRLWQGSNRGQVAVILILLLAVALVFYAIALNLGRVSQIKTITTVASNLSASRMASFMASYGEKIFQEQLGGKVKRCGWTGILAAIIIVVVIIIAIIISIVSWGSAAGGAWAAIAGAVEGAGAAAVMLAVALVASIISLALQVAVIQPGLTKMWNKMMSDSLGPTDLIIEQGVQAGLTAAVTDQVQIPDFFDMDTDGKFGGLDPANPLDKNSAPDYISRFGYYNTLRLRSVQDPDTAEIERFQTALRGFLYTERWCQADKTYPFAVCQYDPTITDEYSSCRWNITGPNPTTPQPAECHRDFGLLDKSMGDICSSGNLNRPAECDPCCLPAFVPDEDTPTIPACEQKSFPRDSECKWNGSTCAWTPADPQLQAAACRPKRLRPSSCPQPSSLGDPMIASCRDRSMFSAAAASFPFVYDPYYEDPLNNNPTDVAVGELARLSFRELLGRDDENDKYTVNAALPNWHWDIRPPAVTPQPDAKQQLIPSISEATNGFYVHDATSFWNADTQRGIYPFFYKMHDWGVELKSLNYQRYQCQWCEAGSTGCPADCMTKYLTPVAGSQINIDTAAAAPLPAPDVYTPPTSTPTAYAGQSTRLDNVNVPSGGTAPLGGPQLMDAIPYIPLLFTAADSATPDDPDTACATGPNVGTTFKGWKQGSDRYCTTQYPYYIGCTKNGGLLPTCRRDDSGGCGGSSDDPLDYRRCGESSASPRLWPDDWLDEITYGMPEFLAYAENFIAQRPGVLAKTFADWYTEMAEWIEPPCCRSSGECTPEVAAQSSCDGSFTQEAREGSLYEWLREMKSFHDPIANWLSASYVGSSCSVGTAAAPGTWCVPPAQASPNAEYGINECPWVSAEEAATFDSNANGVRGDIEDIVSCMDWNLNNQKNDVDGSGATVVVRGNYEKLRQCATVCNATNCTGLPRSLVPGLTPFTGSDPSSAAIIAKIAACYNNDFLVAPGAVEKAIIQISGNGNSAAGDPAVFGPYLADILAKCDPLTGGLVGVPPPPPLLTWDASLFSPPATKLPISWIDQVAGKFYRIDEAGDVPSVPLYRVTVQDFYGTSGATRPLIYNHHDGLTGWTVKTCGTNFDNDPTNPNIVKWIRCPSTLQRIDCPTTQGGTDTQDGFNKQVLACACGFQLGPVSSIWCQKDATHLAPSFSASAPAGVESIWQGNPGEAGYCDVSAAGDDWRTCLITAGDTCATTQGETGARTRNSCSLPLNTNTFGTCGTNQAVYPSGCYCNTTKTTQPPLPFDRTAVAGPQFDMPYCYSDININDIHDPRWPTFLNALTTVKNNATPSLGSCTNTAWVALVQKAAADAKVQMDKMRKRHDFLQSLYFDAKNTAETLHFGIDNFTKFLNNGTPYVDDITRIDSPAERLIWARKHLQDAPRTASTALYVWQDPPPEPPRVNADGTANHDGYWHAVKVEVRIPQRCNDSCGIGGTTDPRWPYVKTYTKSWGMKRCYELDGRQGMVKARVIRYDQNHDAGRLTFPGGKPIWNFRTQHPDALDQADVGSITDTCRIAMIDRDPADAHLLPLVDQSIMDADGGVTQGSYFGWRHAFMINRPPLTSAQRNKLPAAERPNEDQVEDCWNTIHEQMINKGVATDTCAEYYYDGSNPKGFRIRFVKCDTDFLDGLN